MKALLDDGPHEPLFTPIVEPVQQPQQPVAPQQQDTLLHPLLMRNGDSVRCINRRRRCLLWIC